MILIDFPTNNIPLPHQADDDEEITHWDIDQFFGHEDPTKINTTERKPK